MATPKAAVVSTPSRLTRPMVASADEETTIICRPIGKPLRTMTPSRALSGFR